MEAEGIRAELVTIGNRLDAHDKSFDAIVRRLDAHDHRFDTIDLRFEAIDQRFEAIDRRFEAIDLRFEAIDRRFEAIDRRFDVVDQRLDGLTTEFHEFRILQEAQSAKLDRVFDVVISMNERLERNELLAGKVEDHEWRIGNLESAVRGRPRD